MSSLMFRSCCAITVGKAVINLLFQNLMITFAELIDYSIQIALKSAPMSDEISGLSSLKNMFFAFFGANLLLIISKLFITNSFSAANVSWSKIFVKSLLTRCSA